MFVSPVPCTCPAARRPFWKPAIDELEKSKVMPSTRFGPEGGGGDGLGGGGDGDGGLGEGGGGDGLGGGGDGGNGDGCGT